MVGAVCHGPCGLLDATGSDGKSIFNGKQVTGFSNTEEAAVGKTDKVPFLLEDRMKALGGKYEKKGDWNDFSIVDGRLVTGWCNMSHLLQGLAPCSKLTQALLIIGNTLVLEQILAFAPC